MSRRGGVAGLAASIVIACVCVGLIAWRLIADEAPPSARLPLSRQAPAVEAPELPIRLSTIIDLPGDPVLVRRGAVLAPKDALISVPAKLGQEAPKTPAKAFFVNSTLVSTHRRLYGEIPGSRPGSRGARGPVGDELGANGGGSKRAGLRFGR